MTTPVGCQGLGLQDGSDALVRESWADFAAAVAALLAGPDLRARIAAQARRTVECRFDWRRIAEQAWAVYQSLAPRS